MERKQNHNADILGKLMPRRLYNLECGMAVVETRLGWTSMGKILYTENCKKDAALLFTSMCIQEADISKLWRLDAMRITDPIETKSSRRILCKILTVIVNDDKRYEICLPWKKIILILKLIKKSLIINY